MLAVAALILFAGCSFGTPDDLVGPDTPVDPNQSTVDVDRSTNIFADNSDPVTITITVVDRLGRPLPGRMVQVNATGDAASNNFTQPELPTNADGVTTATLRSRKAEVKQISATVDPGGNPVELTQSQNVQFIAGQLAKLTFLTTPDNEIAGAPMTPPIQIAFADEFDNVVSSATGTITVLRVPDSSLTGVLSGTKTVAAIAGVATFSDLVIDKVGIGYSLEALSIGVPQAVRTPLFNVVFGPAAQVVFTVNPGSGVPAYETVAFAPAVQVALQDAGGNVLLASNATVTIAIGANPGGGTLSGTKSVAAVNGIATFNDLSIDRAGSTTH